MADWKGDKIVSRFDDYLNRVKRKWGSDFDASYLSKQFVPYYNDGSRIEVDLGGEIKRGTIGITTGHKPCFLLMLTKRSLGSSWCLKDTDKVLKVIRKGDFQCTSP